MEFCFEWRLLSPEELKRANESREEDYIVACIPVGVRVSKVDDTQVFIVDVHHEKYVGERPCFDLELYTSNKYGEHLVWLKSIKMIKTATSYHRFCRRAESLIMDELYFYCLEGSSDA